MWNWHLTITFKVISKFEPILQAVEPILIGPNRWPIFIAIHEKKERIALNGSRCGTSIRKQSLLLLLPHFGELLVKPLGRCLYLSIRIQTNKSQTFQFVWFWPVFVLSYLNAVTFTDKSFFPHFTDDFLFQYSTLILTI